MLVEIAKSMGKSYFKYVEKTFPLILKYIDYKYSKLIRHSMMNTLCYMMESCDNEDFMARIFENSLKGFLKQLDDFTLLKNDEECYTIL